MEWEIRGAGPRRRRGRQGCGSGLWGDESGTSFCKNGTQAVPAAAADILRAAKPRPSPLPSPRGRGDPCEGAGRERGTHPRILPIPMNRDCAHSTCRQNEGMRKRKAAAAWPGRAHWGTDATSCARWRTSLPGFARRPRQIAWRQLAGWRAQRRAAGHGGQCPPLFYIRLGRGASAARSMSACILRI